MYLLADIGRTKTRLAFSPDGERFGEPVIEDTDLNFASCSNHLKATLNQISGAGHESDPLILGISRKVWPEVDLKVELPRVLGRPVYIENDSALVGLGEAVSGAGRGPKIMVYVTVSSGVGGAKIEEGKIDQSAHGFEPGQQIVVIGEKSETLEELVSGLAVERRFGRPAREITDEAVWQELSQYLAIGLTNTLLHWSPDCLVLGGSMFKVPGFKVPVVAALIAEQLKIFSPLPTIKLAELGAIGGLHGALAYARSLPHS
ncbi:MAG: ROK family protein [Patescibacteria group bacterium]